MKLPLTKKPVSEAIGLSRIANENSTHHLRVLSQLLFIHGENEFFF